MSRRRIHILGYERLKRKVSRIRLHLLGCERLKRKMSRRQFHLVGCERLKRKMSRRRFHLLGCEGLNRKMSRGLHLLGCKRLNRKLWNLMVHTRLCMILPGISRANDSYFNVVFLFLISAAGRHWSDCCSAYGKNYAEKDGGIFRWWQ
jgi:hypothetical protein